MIVGLYQAPQPGNVQEGIATINAALSAGAQSGADMLVLPDAFLPGYTAVAREIPKAWDEIQEDIANLCRRHKVGLTIGLPEYVEDRLFNSAHAFADDGRPLASYRKIQLFGPDEQALYTAGDAYVTFAFKGTRFGLLICYDAEFPEHVRHLARLGAEVILVPTANMMPFVNVNQILIPARAAESAVTIVYANYCGTSGGLEYVGLSAIHGPDGYPLGAKGAGEGLVVAELPDGWSEHGIPLSSQLDDLRHP
ncbi:MAG: nitrilase [Boseongicola sp.]|nr:nitrilase [Boseongicola sp.]